MKSFRQYLIEKKKLFKGIFNWHGQNITLYTHAGSTNAAKTNLLKQLIGKVQYDRKVVYGYYQDNPEGYTIKEMPSDSNEGGT